MFHCKISNLFLCESSREMTPTRRPPSPSARLIFSSRSRRMNFVITVIGTVVVVIVTIYIKWTILKPIHTELVEKFKTNHFLYIEHPSVCRTMNLGTRFKLFTFPFSCLLIVIFSMLTKRTSSNHSRWYLNYGGVPVPLDFFAHIKRTFSAMIFAIYADELVEIVNELIEDDNTEESRGQLSEVTRFASRT